MTMEKKRRQPSSARAAGREGLEAASILLSLHTGSQRGADTSEDDDRPSTSSWNGVKAARINARTVTPPTRSYVWRGPRSATAVSRLRNNAAADAAADTSHSSSDDDGAARAAAGKSRDKEWAALTTWLRMNLHQPRTLKKLVLFVGKQDPANGCWSFDLNPGLAWHDVSPETKLRLKTLPQETEVAFALKYPARPPGDWALKSQKYRLPGSSLTATVPLADMVHSLRDIFARHEECGAASAPPPASAPPAAAPLLAPSTPSADAAAPEHAQQPERDQGWSPEAKDSPRSASAAASSPPTGVGACRDAAAVAAPPGQQARQQPSLLKAGAANGAAASTAVAVTAAPDACAMASSGGSADERVHLPRTVCV